MGKHKYWLYMVLIILASILAFFIGRAHAVKLYEFESMVGELCNTPVYSEFKQSPVCQYFYDIYFVPDDIMIWKAILFLYFGACTDGDDIYLDCETPRWFKYY